MFILATRAGRTFPTPRLIPWPPLFLFGRQPGIDIAEPLVANVNERFKQSEAAFINALNFQADPFFFFTTRGIDAFSLRKIAKKFKLGASLLNKMKISSFQM